MPLSKCCCRHVHTHPYFFVVCSFFPVYSLTLLADSTPFLFLLSLVRSHIGERGITGPICQLRSTKVANEKGHGMCKPHGCVNVLLSRMRRPPSMHNWKSLGGPKPNEPPIRTPALLFLHGETSVHKAVLPPNFGRYWPLEQAGAAVEEEGSELSPVALARGGRTRRARSSS